MTSFIFESTYEIFLMSMGGLIISSFALIFSAIEMVRYYNKSIELKERLVRVEAREKNLQKRELQ